MVLKMYKQYGRHIGYIVKGQQIYVEWYQTRISDTRSIVMREDYTDGISLTNSIETAIAYLCRIFEKDFVENKNVRIFHDCGLEGVFEVTYTVDFQNFIRYDDYLMPEVYNVKWNKFANNLDTFNILYGRAS